MVEPEGIDHDRSVGAAAPAKQPGRFRATVAEGAVQTDSKPAAAAGVRVGDTITAVDGKDVAGWRCYLVFGLLSAKADTSIGSSELAIAIGMKYQTSESRAAAAY